MIKYIVFDFDGTLADTLSFIKEIAYEEFENVSEIYGLRDDIEEKSVKMI